MKRIFLLLLGFSSIGLLQAQIGVYTDSPKATLDVYANSIDGSTAEGMSAPRLTLSELASKDSKYQADQTGSIVYITNVTGTATSKTRNIISAGYYYFDGTLWQTVGPDTGFEFIYKPSLLLPTDISDPAYNSSTQTFTIDLYSNYAGQYGMTNSSTSIKSPSATSLPVLKSTDFEYLITYYDNTVYQSVAVSPAGVLTYKLPATPPTITDKTYMNIIFKIK